MITLTTIVAPAKPRPEKTYRIRKEAEAAAVMAIGPHARKGFEFEAFKCDGAWRWREFDEVRPPNAAELKASGGKKSILAAAATSGTAMAKIRDGVIEPATYDELKASGGLRSASVPKGDGLDLPPVLKRTAKPKLGSPIMEQAVDYLKDLAKEAQEVRVADHVDVKVGPMTAIPMPTGPCLLVTPQKPQDAPKKAKATRTAPKPTKRATKAPTQTAGAFKSKTNIGTVARTAILRGKSNEEALTAVMKAFPNCSSNLGCMAWYRNRLKRDGYFKQNGSPSAKGEALLAQAEAPGF